MSEGEAASLSRGTPSGHKGQSKTTDGTKKRQGERNKQKHKESAKQVCALCSGDFSVDVWVVLWTSLLEDSVQPTDVLNEWVGVDGYDNKTMVNSWLWLGEGFGCQHESYTSELWNFKLDATTWWGRHGNQRSKSNQCWLNRYSCCVFYPPLCSLRVLSAAVTAV